MRAMIVKEFRQLRRDRRTLAMMIVMPVLLLVILGYAASFDVSDIPTVVAGRGAAAAATALPKSFQVAATYTATAGQTEAATAWAHDELRDGHAAVAIVTAGAGGGSLILVDGSQLFTAQAALRQFAAERGGTTATASAAEPGRGRGGRRCRYPGPVQPAAEDVVHHDPRAGGRHPGVRRDRDHEPRRGPGTPGRDAGATRGHAAAAGHVFLGKIVPYFAVAVADLVIVLAVGVAVFGVPFRGSARCSGSARCCSSSSPWASAC